MKPFTAFVFPSLLEEILWRGIFLPHPSATTIPYYNYYSWSGIVLIIHVLVHPLLGSTIWPRGKQVFYDPRFLLLATIVLGGATISYLVSGGSVWAAALTHGLAVALWSDFFNGESKLIATFIDIDK